MRRRRAESFAEVVERLSHQPARGPDMPAGRNADCWGDPEGRRYELETEQLSPADAVGLARRGARVVYDACGCGGQECRLDWLSVPDVAELGLSAEPTLHPSKDGRADLEHWRSADGQDLLVVAVEVTWGSRIRG